MSIHAGITPPHLPLLQKAIFVDWNGVLSHDPFWISILRSTVHPLHSELSTAVQWLFKQNNDVVNSWMRGQVSAKEVIKLLGITLDRRYAGDFLQRRLLQDCQEMKVCKGLVTLLRKAADHAFIVIATDNMDCFYAQVAYLRSKSKRSHSDEASGFTLKDAIWHFDDILCSSAIGVLKREEPEAFFEPWLRVHSLGFADALLLDDVEANCCAFRRAGGAAIKIGQSDYDEHFRAAEETILHWATAGSNLRDDASAPIPDMPSPQPRRPTQSLFSWDLIDDR